MKKKLPLGGEIQSLLPLLDLAVPGVGTALSAVVGMIPGKQATKKLEAPTNPFRTFRKGGSLVTDKQAKFDPGKPKKKVKLGDIEFYEDEIRDSNKLVRVAKDLRTGKDYGVVKTPEGQWRFKTSEDKDTYLNRLTNEYDSKFKLDHFLSGRDEINVNPDDYVEATKGKDKGVKIPKAVIDSTITSARRMKEDPSKLLGLISRESAYGLGVKGSEGQRDFHYKGDLVSSLSMGSQYLPISVNNFLANKGVPGVKVQKTSAGWNYDISDEKALEEHLSKNPGLVKEYSKYLNNYKYPENVDSFDWALDKLKKEGLSSYNPGDPQYPQKLQKDINAVKSDPNIQSYIKKRTPELKFGGKLKAYDLPTHEQGGGMVDKMGNPASGGVAEIEKKEVVYTDKRGTNPYVFSDTLIDSDGKTFAMKAKEYQKFDKKDQVSQATYKKLMNELQMKNDLARENKAQVANATQMPNGGSLGNPVTLGNPLLPTLGQFKYPNVTAPGQLQTMQQTDTPVVQDMTNLNLGTPITGQNTTPGMNLNLSPSGNPVAKNPLGSLDLGKIGGIMKGAALVGSAVDAFQKPEEEQLRVPDFSKGDKAYTGLGGSFDPIRNDIVQQAKTGENQIMQSAGNFGQVMSRLNALQAGVGRNFAQVGLQEKQYNDQIRMSKGQREDQKATITANEQIRKQTADSQNKAMGQDLVANLLQNVNNYGTEFMKQDAMTKQLQALDKEKQRAFLTQLALMNIKNPNFQINKDLINSDNPLSALTFKQ